MQRLRPEEFVTVIHTRWMGVVLEAHDWRDGVGVEWWVCNDDDGVSEWFATRPTEAEVDACVDGWRGNR